MRNRFLLFLCLAKVGELCPRLQTHRYTLFHSSAEKINGLSNAQK